MKTLIQLVNEKEENIGLFEVEGELTEELENKIIAIMEDGQIEEDPYERLEKELNLQRVFTTEVFINQTPKQPC